MNQDKIIFLHSLIKQTMSSTKKLFVILLLFLGGNVLASVAMVVVGMSQGVPIEDIGAMFSDPEFQSKSILRTMLLIQAFAIFIIPAYIFGWIYYRENIWSYYKLNRTPVVLTAVLCVVVMIAGQSLVLLSYEINSLLPLPHWMHTMEQNVSDILGDILDMQNLGALIITFILVAVLPAVGEELLFRGIVQRQLGNLFNREVAAIWVTAVIFSAVHLQFEGFLPRMVLGALLGYLYYWSRNLWLPILGHMLNNGIPICVLYFSGTDLSQVDEGTRMSPVVWVVSALVSIVVIFFAGKTIKRKSLQHV